MTPFAIEFSRYPVNGYKILYNFLQQISNLDYGLKTFSTVSPISAGLSATVTPELRKQDTFSATVPLPPAIMAPRMTHSFAFRRG